MKNYVSFIKEINTVIPVANKKFYSIGDEVSINGTVDGREFREHQGTVSDICRTSINADRNENGKCDPYIYRGQCYYIREFDWWVSPFNLSPAKEIKKIIDPVVDPYGEEQWGDMEVEEEITEAVKGMETLLGLENKGAFTSIVDILGGEAFISFPERRQYVIDLFRKTVGKKVYFYNYKNGKNLKKERILTDVYWTNQDNLDEVRIYDWSLRIIGTKKEYYVNILRPIGYYESGIRITSSLNPDINKIKNQIKEIRRQKMDAIDHADLSKAAKLRDEERRLEEELLNVGKTKPIEPKETIRWYSHGKLEGDWE